MKELSIEEKAKAYDVAIKKAKSKIKDDKDHVLYEDDIIDLFPELAESEDGKMVQYFKDLAPFDKADELYKKYGFSHKDAIAWLEKQGEHANFLNKIQVGDKVTRNEDGVLVNLSQLNRVAKKDEKQGEQKPTWKPSEWQIKALWELMRYAPSLSVYTKIQESIESLYNDLKKLNYESKRR